MNKIYPLLKFYYYSSKSPTNSSAITSIPNNSFFNSLNTNESIASAICTNVPNSSFDKNIFTHTYNSYAKLYLHNNNNILSNSIGNLLAKVLSIKINNFNNIYAYNSLLTYYIYDQSNFNLGTILCSYTYNYLSQIDSNGSLIDNKYLLNIIYSDGYYTYLMNNTSLKITIEIINGIRNVTIPSDPTNNYDPIDNILNYNLIDLFSFKNTNSNFTPTDNPLCTYLITGQIFDINSHIQIGTTLNSYTIVLNTNNSNNYDCAEYQIFSIDKTSSMLAKSGKILGLIVESNKIITTFGSFSNTIRILNGIILYADGDFAYLNSTNKLLPYKESIDKKTAIRTISVPDISINNIPITFVPENQVINKKAIYYTFYHVELNNSNVYNNTIDTQEFTLGTNYLYDSYDSINNIYGNVIGSMIVNKTTSILHNNDILTMTNISYNFNNGLILFIVGVYIKPLTKIGNLINGITINQKIISCSPEFNTLTYTPYNITVISGSPIFKVSINCLRN